MRRSTTTFLAGAIAFGLTAASAAVTSFTISAFDEPKTDFATTAFLEGSCTGDYELQFTRDENGEVDGGTATRTAPEGGPDTNLRFCVGVPAYVELYDPVNIPASGSDPNYADFYAAEYISETGADGGFTFEFGPNWTPVAAQDGWEVRVQIGDDAANLPLPVPIAP